MPFPPKTPYLAVDGIINVQSEEGEWIGLVLIERKYPPVGLAIPGGFVEVGESVEKAVIREMKEETGLDVIVIRQFKVYSDPNRDPRFHTVSVFLSALQGENRPERVMQRSQRCFLTMKFRLKDSSLTTQRY